MFRPCPTQAQGPAPLPDRTLELKALKPIQHPMQRTFSHSSVGRRPPSSQPHLQAAPWFVVPPSATRPDVRSPAFRRPSLVLLWPDRLQPAVICAETERPFPVLHMIRPKAANLFLLSLAATPPHPTNPPPPGIRQPWAAAHGSCHCRLGSALSHDVPCSFPSRQTIPRTPLSCHCRLGSAPSYDVPCSFPLRRTTPRTPLSCHCRLGSALSHDVPCSFLSR